MYSSASFFEIILEMGILYSYPELKEKSLNKVDEALPGIFCLLCFLTIVIIIEAIYPLTCDVFVSLNGNHL